MKKLFIITIPAIFIISTSYSQILQKSVPASKNNVIIKTVPSPPPPPPPPPPPTPAANTPYYLTSARVNIRTGNDNKEFPSEVTFQLSNALQFIMQQRGENMRNEMKINSNTEFGLEKTKSVKPEDFTLEAMKIRGIELRIVYFPDFFMNAWKIEGVSITLEFKDQNGTPHPTFGSKTIIFNNATGFLDAINKILVCKTDEQLNPTTSSILEK